jgi:ribosomal protein S18 acetylase RimI-like enzyme
MDVRTATEADLAIVRALYEEFMEERPPPAYLGDALEENLRLVDAALRDGGVFLAEDDEQVVGFALAYPKQTKLGSLSDLFVRPAFRRRGAAAALMRAVSDAFRQRGFTHVTLNVDVDNADARAVYERWGFRTESYDLVVDLDTLDRRLDREAAGESFGSVHVQTDDLPEVEKIVRRYVPLLRGRSEGTVVMPPRHGWISVYDELADREPEQLRRLAREISHSVGSVVLAIGVEDGAVAHYVLYERGRNLDEYMSVPEYQGPRPSGEVVALAANPVLVERLTGADRQEIRAAAVQGSSPDDLPPAKEIVAAIGRAMRIEGAELGYATVSSSHDRT